MRIIGVIDVRGGRAVHARAGLRHQYVPVEAVSGEPIAPGDALELAHRYIERLGVRELYVADLDAILGDRHQATLTKALVAIGVPVWLDAGITSVDAARRARDFGVAHVIVGLETLPSFDTLRQICNGVRPHESSIAFSLDLRDGQPLVRTEDGMATPALEDIVAGVLAAQVETMIVLDLARVGMGAGPDLTLIDRLRGLNPKGRLIAGGGVRDRRDLDSLAARGCSGALVATALLTGAVTAADVAGVHDGGTYLPSTEKASNTLPGMKPIEL